MIFYDIFSERIGSDGKGVCYLPVGVGFTVEVQGSQPCAETSHAEECSGVVHSLLEPQFHNYVEHEVQQQIHHKDRQQQTAEAARPHN